MTRTRASKHSEAACTTVAALALALGCGAGASPPAVGVPAVAGSAEPSARRPDAVVVEPPAAMPSAVARADARGVIALREPLAGDAVRELVQSLVDAWQRESLDALASLLTLDAGPLEARGRGRGSLIEGWRQRMHAHEYGRLSGVDLVRPERIERWEWSELGASDAPARPPEMRPDEVYVRVPLEVTRIAGEKLFDDVIVLVLRREEGKYKIAAYGETDAP